jgi:hypothetical protein
MQVNDHAYFRASRLEVAQKPPMVRVQKQLRDRHTYPRRKDSRRSVVSVNHGRNQCVYFTDIETNDHDFA